MFDEYEDDPVKLIKQLDKEFKATRSREVLAVLVELCYVQGQSGEKEMMTYYLSSCVYAYRYLFDNTITPAPTPYNPEFLYICRFYNYSLASVMNHWMEEDINISGDSVFNLVDGQITFKPTFSNLDYPLFTYKKFLVCNDYLPYGLQNFSRESGLGVPLIVVRNEDIDVSLKKNSTTVEQNQFCTLFLRISLEPGRNMYAGKMEFYDPLKTDWIKINGKNVPLDIDMSTPLAHLLRKGPLFSGIKAMFDAGVTENLQGLYMLGPYQKNKIPVVFVHGLMSRPRTWVQMLNTLLKDPEIRKNYQFWFYLYPTGNPIVYSGNIFRKTLLATRNKYDPEGKNPCFNRMVLIGHSMGGLLSKMMIQNSDKQLYDTVFSASLDKLDVTAKQRKFIQELLIFKRLPFVTLVIFNATPHRGTEIAAWSISRFASSMITLPRKLVHKLHGFSKKAIEKIKLGTDTDKISPQTGIDGLDPKSEVINAMAELPYDPEVTYHSIIGNEDEAGIADGSDGLVPYESAHLEDAETELIVKSDHSVHQKAHAIREVRRILLEHLNAGKSDR